MIKRTRLSVLLIVVIIACLHSRSAANELSPGNATVAFINVNVVPMDGERVIRNQTVVVREGRISAIGSANRLRVPRGAIKLDGRGRYLMPGLVDMHVHLEHLEKEPQLWLFIANGVTTVRNMDGRPHLLVWRERIANGALAGPIIYTAGTIIEGKPPFWKDTVVVETPAQAEEAVAEQKKAGYDFIKVYHTLNREVYQAITVAARKHGMRVAGHVPTEVGLDGAFAARQASIEHLQGYVRVIEAEDSPLRDRWSWQKLYFAVRVDDGKIGRAAQATRQAGVWNVPTLIQSQKVAPRETAQAWLKRPEMIYLPPEAAGLWRQANARIVQRMEPSDFEELAGGERVRGKLIKALRDAGARLLVGTDTPNPFVIPGFSVHEELQNLVEAGLTPYEAISAGTREAAEFLGASGEFGTVAVGKRADLILLEGNPLESVVNTTKRAGVMVRGRWHTAADLQQQLSALAASYERK